MRNGLNTAMFGAQLYYMRNMAPKVAPAVPVTSASTLAPAAEVGTETAFSEAAAPTATAGAYIPLAIGSLAGAEVGEGISSRFLPFGSKTEKKTYGSVAGGAAAGAAIGTYVFPGIGTGAGAVAGGLVGLAKRLFRI